MLHRKTKAFAACSLAFGLLGATIAVAQGGDDEDVCTFACLFMGELVVWPTNTSCGEGEYCCVDYNCATLEHEAICCDEVALAENTCYRTFHPFDPRPICRLTGGGGGNVDPIDDPDLPQ